MRLHNKFAINQILRRDKVRILVKSMSWPDKQFVKQLLDRILQTQTIHCYLQLSKFQSFCDHPLRENQLNPHLTNGGQGANNSFRVRDLGRMWCAEVVTATWCWKLDTFLMMFDQACCVCYFLPQQMNTLVPRLLRLALMPMERLSWQHSQCWICQSSSMKLVTHGSTVLEVTHTRWDRIGEKYEWICSIRNVGVCNGEPAWPLGRGNYWHVLYFVHQPSIVADYHAIIKVINTWNNWYHHPIISWLYTCNVYTCNVTQCNNPSPLPTSSMKHAHQASAHLGEELLCKFEQQFHPWFWGEYSHVCWIER